MKDIGVIGNWYGLNYGSALTYYALGKILQKKGINFDLIDTSYRGTIHENCINKSKNFLSENFNIREVNNDGELQKLNNEYKGFVTGSDQLWNRGISRRYDYIFYLGFANTTKFKAAISTSFGHDADFASDEEREKISSLLKDFDYISLREFEGQRICREFYDIYNTEVILDPVFLNYKDYLKLDINHSLKNNDYLLAYILDVDISKRNFVICLAELLGLNPVFVLDGDPDNYNRKKELIEDCFLMENSLSHYEWLNLIKNSSYVVTDSFHGSCFSMIFRKEFLCFKNKHRGLSRFNSLSTLANLNERFIDYEGGELIKDSKLIYELLNSQIDYKYVFRFLDLKVNNNLNKLNLLFKYFGENYD